MPAPLFRSASIGNASATNVDVPEPAGLTAGDFCVLNVMSGANAADITDPTDWSLFTEADEETAFNVTSQRFHLEIIGDETWPLNVVVDTDFQIIAICMAFNPNGGSGWVINDDGAAPATANSDTGTPPSVTAVNDSMYITNYITDGFQLTVSTAPTDMTQAEGASESGGAHFAYYEARSAGAVQKSLVWSGTDGVHSYGMILSIGAGAAAGFTPRSYPRGANRGLMRGVA